MRTRTMIQLGTVVSATLTALAASVACGGSQPEANTPTNEGAPPSSESNTSAPTGTTSGTDTSGTDTTGGGPSGMGAGGATSTSPGTGTTTPPEGYAGSR